MPLTEIQEAIRDIIVRKQELISKRRKFQTQRDAEIDAANAAAKEKKDFVDQLYESAAATINAELAQIELKLADLDTIIK